MISRKLRLVRDTLCTLLTLVRAGLVRDRTGDADGCATTDRTHDGTGCPGVVKEEDK